jgi:hypothetical protein
MGSATGAASSKTPYRISQPSWTSLRGCPVSSGAQIETDAGSRHAPDPVVQTPNGDFATRDQGHQLVCIGRLVALPFPGDEHRLVSPQHEPAAAPAHRARQVDHLPHVLGAPS